MNVIDSGVPVLNMHAPWEIISKVDLYEAYRGYIAFLKEAQGRSMNDQFLTELQNVMGGSGIFMEEPMKKHR